MKRILPVLIMLAYFVLPNCAHVDKHSQNVCPEYSSLTCFSGIQCDRDEERG